MSSAGRGKPGNPSEGEYVGSSVALTDVAASVTYPRMRPVSSTKT